MDIYTFLTKDLYVTGPVTTNPDGTQSATVATKLGGYGETTSESIVSGEVDGNLSFIGGFIQSKNFVTGTSGWRLSSDGSFEGSSGTFRGSLNIGGSGITNKINFYDNSSVLSSTIEAYVSGNNHGSTISAYSAGVIKPHIDVFVDTVTGQEGIRLFTSANSGILVSRESGVDYIYLNANIHSDLTPYVDVGIDMGTSALKWDDIWCDELHYNTLTLISDEKTKEHIQPMSEKREKLLKLAPKKYIRKETGKIEYGLVAQDVQAIMPEAVREHTDKNTGEVTLGIDMGAIMTMCLQTIQTLDKEVRALKKALK